MRDHLRLYIRMVVVFLIIALGCRLAFLILFNSESGQLAVGTIAVSLLHGLRFDAATFAILFGLIISLMLLPISARIWRYTLWGITLFLFFFVFVFSVGDNIFYSISHRRSAAEMFAVFASARDLWSFVSGSAIFVVPGAILGPLPFYFIFRKQIKGGLPPLQFRFALPASLFTIFISIIAIRGGLQGRPLNVTHAFVTGDYFLGNVTLNPVFAFLKLVYDGDSLPVNRALGNLPVSEIQKMLRADHENFLNIEYPFFRESNPPQAPLKKNVVILIMESWSAADMGAFGNVHKATPNFDTLVRDGLLFTNAYALGSRSITAIPTIVSSIATMFGKAYTTSAYATNKQRGMGTIFREQGYDTIFLAGYKAGAQGFSTYMKVAGFEKVLTREAFGLSKDKSDGVWGIYDEYTVEELHKVLAKTRRPFIAVWPSLHPHHPYKLPETYADRKFYTQIERTDHFNALRYSDYALGKFFALARKSAYFKDTVFILTADHTYTQKGVIAKFHVPILVYSPAFVRAGRDARIASQLDILPSLLDLLHVKTTHASMGKSLFTAEPHNWVMVDIDSSVGFFEPPYALIANREKPVAAYDFADKTFSADLLRDSTKVAALEKVSRRWYTYMNIVSDAIQNNRLAP